LEFFAVQSVEDLARQLRREYRSFGTTALGLRQLLKRIRLTVVGELDPAVAVKMGVEVEPSLSQAVEKALAALPLEAQVAVLPHAQFTLPVVEES
jgi:hypothetical protein